MAKTINARFKSTLRELWSQSEFRADALKLVKVKVQEGFYKNGNPKYRVKYPCAQCSRLFNSDDVEVDHKEELPLIDWTIPLGQNKNIQKWLDALFISPIDGLQVMCKKCHAYKTAEYALYRELGGQFL